MSLKAFHIAFITVSSLLTLVLAGWAFLRVEGAMGTVWALAAIAAGAVLILYGMRFLKKMKDIQTT